MGQWVEGLWQAGEIAPTDAKGKFVRTDAKVRNWITPDGSAGPTGRSGFAAESGRYHLYVSLACPWASRTLILRAWKGLEPHIGLSVTHWWMGEQGWTSLRAVGSVLRRQGHGADAFDRVGAASGDYYPRLGFKARGLRVHYGHANRR